MNNRWKHVYSWHSSLSILALLTLVQIPSAKAEDSFYNKKNFHGWSACATTGGSGVTNSGPAQGGKACFSSNPRDLGPNYQLFTYRHPKKGDPSPSSLWERDRARYLNAMKSRKPCCNFYRQF